VHYLLYFVCDSKYPVQAYAGNQSVVLTLVSIFFPGEMMSDLLVRPERFRDRIEGFGYYFLAFETRKLEAGRKHRGETAGRELAMVVLGGVCSVTSSRGDWQGIGQRKTDHVYSQRGYGVRFGFLLQQG
jgi:hypothetical protein